ncbi:hypothetical protein GJ496_008512 [Pomphorhynchus laevis]|nr:hypothetical protein GJ496_008512 [Pomphorhynchus laevis]
MSSQSNVTLRYCLLNPDASAPVRGSCKSAGLDLSSVERVIILAGQRALIDTGICVAIPDGYYGRIAPRSGLAVKHGIDIGAGVIDSDYRGQIKILLFNHGDTDYIVDVGSRIAQLICEKIAIPELLEVSSLDDTSRGSKGFGSSGI